MTYQDISEVFKELKGLIRRINGILKPVLKNTSYERQVFELTRSIFTIIEKNSSLQTSAALLQSSNIMLDKLSKMKLLLTNVSDNTNKVEINEIKTSLDQFSMKLTKAILRVKQENF